VNVFLSDDKMSIILGREWFVNDEGEEDSNDFEGYTNIGDICCDCWRWMASDIDTIKPEVYKAFKEEREHMDFVEVDVPHGKWKVKHFYDFPHTSDDYKKGVWARLDLVGHSY
jgi:hypothetical protein